MSDLKAKKKDIDKLIKSTPQFINDLHKIKEDDKLIEYISIEFGIDYLLGAITRIHSDIKRAKKSS